MAVDGFSRSILSDVVSAFLVVYATARLLYYLMYERQGFPAKNSPHAEGGDEPVCARH